jgi:hypothetical protein
LVGSSTHRTAPRTTPPPVPPHPPHHSHPPAARAREEHRVVEREALQGVRRNALSFLHMPNEPAVQ